MKSLKIKSISLRKLSLKKTQNCFHSVKRINLNEVNSLCIRKFLYNQFDFFQTIEEIKI